MHGNQSRTPQLANSERYYSSANPLNEVCIMEPWPYLGTILFQRDSSVCNQTAHGICWNFILTHFFQHQLSVCYTFSRMEDRRVSVCLCVVLIRVSATTKSARGRRESDVCVWTVTLIQFPVQQPHNPATSGFCHKLIID